MNDNSYGKNSIRANISLLFAAALSMNFLPDFLKTMQFGMAKHSLSGKTVLLDDLVGILLGLFFLFLFVYLVFGRDGSQAACGVMGIRKGFFKRDPGEGAGYGKRFPILHLLLGIAPCILICMLTIKGFNWLILYLVYSMRDRGYLPLMISGVIGVVLILLFGLCFYLYVAGCMRIRTKHPLVRVLTRFYAAIPMAVLLVAAVICPSLMVYLQGKIFPAGMMVRLGLYVLGALIETGLLAVVFTLIRFMAKPGSREMPQGDYAPNTPGQTSSTSGIIKLAFEAIIFACTLVIFTGLYAKPAAGPSTARMNENFQQRLVNYEMSLMTADLGGAALEAAYNAELCRSYREVLGKRGKDRDEEAEDADSDYEDRLWANVLQDPELMNLHAYLYRDPSELENAIRMKGTEADSSAAIALLDYYGKQNKGARDHEELETLAVQICLRDGVFSSPYPDIEELRDNSMDAKEVLEAYAVFEEQGRALAYLNMQKEGSLDAEALALAALDAAEEHPRDRMLQYAAAVCGSDLTYDGAGHYDRTAEAIKRYEKLTRKEKDPDGEELVALKMETAKMLLKIHHAEDAVQMLEAIPVKERSRLCFERLAEGYAECGKDEEALETAQKYLDRADNSPYLMYYAALSTLKLKDVDASIKYAAQLAGYTEAAEGEEALLTDIYMFSLLQFYTLHDNTSYTGYDFGIYEDLTDAQNKQIDKTPYLRNYLDAVYLGFHNKDDDSMKEALAKIEQVISANKNLASPLYMKGVIYATSGLENRLKEAESAYLASAAINYQIAATWYALAKIYDETQEYEKGIEACERALALVAADNGEVDHGEDWYGIGYHCKRLLDAMKAAVK